MKSRRTSKFPRINVIILNTIRGLDHLGILQTWDGLHHRFLELFRNTAGDSVWIYQI